MLSFLLTPPRQFLSYVGRGVLGFIGRVGLAIRHLGEQYLLRPLLWLTSPFRFVYRRWLDRPVRTLTQFLYKNLIRRPAAAIAALPHRLWLASAPQRRRWRRRRNSRLQIWQARIRVALYNPLPPAQAIHAPRPPVQAQPARRPARLLATVVTINVVIVAFSLVLTQEGQTGANAPVEQIVDIPATSEPTATIPPTATATPLPIITPSPTTDSPLPTWTPWPTPDPLTTGGSIVFSLRQGGNSDLYVLSVGRFDPVRLTNHPADDETPAWSPDGRRIAFASNRDGNWELYVLDLQTGTLRRITNDVAYQRAPRWSPDGEWLVFEGYHGENLDIYIAKADGSALPIRLTEHAAPDFSPVWSPGGRHIAFSSWRTGNKDIFIMSLDGATDASAVNVTNTIDQHEDNPTFNPDGTYVAYDDVTDGFGLVYATALLNYAPAGSPPLSFGQGTQPTWSPEGNTIAYVHQRGEQSFLIASSLDAWSVAPQAYAAIGVVDAPMWSAMTLPAELPASILQIANAPDVPLYVEAVTPAEDGPPLLLQEMNVNAPAPFLTDRADESFNALRTRVLTEAGWDFLGQLDAMFAPIDAAALPSQSAQSWHKAGRAFDINSQLALALNPSIEIVREDVGDQTFWRVYLRASVQDGSVGAPLRTRPWDFRARFGPNPEYYDNGGRLRDFIPAGYYIDFTQLAADYGWTSVPAADNWRTFFPGILFWQFEYRGSLAWEQAMLELYTPDEILNVFSTP